MSFVSMVSTCGWLALLAVTVACGPSPGSEPEGGGTTGPEGDATTTSSPPGTSTGPGDSTGWGASSGDAPVDLPDECSTFEQDCPAGYKCSSISVLGDPLHPEETACVPVLPDPAAPGEPCTIMDSIGFDDCDAESMCWFVDPETLQGFCQPFCGLSGCPNACDDCAIDGSGVLGVCFSECDPRASNCPGDLRCELFLNGFVCNRPLTQGDGLGTAGSACEGPHDCVVDHLCMVAEHVPGCTEEVGCCTPMCTVGDGGSCAAVPGTSCEPYFGADQVLPSCSFSDLGVCMVP